MRWFRIVVFLILLGAVGTARAGQVVILKGATLQPFQEAVQAFRRTLEASAAHRGPRSVEPVVFRELTLSSETEEAPLLERVRALKPDLVLAAGGLALDALRGLEDVPIVYVLVHSPPPWARKRTNVTGVEMTVPPERWVPMIRAAFPDRSRLGLLFDPGRSGGFVRDAEVAAARDGLSLVALEIRSPREVPSRLRELEGRIDVFWMIPDLTVVTPQSVEALLLFSLRHRVPIVTFSESYLRRGATAAGLLDFGGLGRQAGEMARRLLDGARVDRVPPEYPADLRLQVNDVVAEKLGVVVGAVDQAPTGGTEAAQ